MIFRYKTIGGKTMGGPLYDTADDIFSGAVEDYAKLSGGGGEPEGGELADTEPKLEDQDVDPNKGQGETEEKGAPGTPDKSADESAEKIEKAEGEKKEKVDSVGEVRKWGEGWEKTAGEREAKLKELEPTIKFVEEKFGGQENLNLAAEIYEAVADEDAFDPANAVEFLSSNLPGVADKLVTYIAQNVAQKATSTALERTFGRKLSEQDIKDVTTFLASGKQSDPRKLDSFLDKENIPEHLKFDSEGNERDPQVLDYLWKQQQALNEAHTKLQNLEGRVNGADEERQQQVASEAISKYVEDNFQGIHNKISELNLDKPVDGETAEIATLRGKYASLLEGVAMWFASNNTDFQSMYKLAVQAVARASTNPADRVSKAKSVDYSRRIKARVDEFAADAAELISPLIDSFAAKRGEQVEKTTKAKPEPDATGGVETKTKELDPNKDPFDSDDIQAEVKDILRARRAR